MTFELLTIFMIEPHQKSSIGFLICFWYCLVMLFGMLVGWQQKPTFSGLAYPSYVFYMLRRNGLARNILQKDIIYYFKYWGFSGIFTINDHISDNSIQINIRFTFTAHEYIIVYKYILLSNFRSILYIIYYIYIHTHTLVTPVLHSHNLFQLVFRDDCQ